MFEHSPKILASEEKASTTHQVTHPAPGRGRVGHHLGQFGSENTVTQILRLCY